MICWNNWRSRCFPGMTSMRGSCPGREEPTAYRVWVSEIMLQQTRVEAVKPYYERFMEALPGIRELAACPEERLLKLWEGLGYYNRARNLKKAAEILVEEYEGVMPKDYEAVLALPGIGSTRRERSSPSPMKNAIRRWMEMF